ncbi:MAG: VWA domain-containing protein [Burkholderiales bacterium]|nr:VWA domain-containing protein [Burkholderiales bacterium]
MKKHPPRSLAALLSAQLMLAACTATAHTPLPPEPARWPEPQIQSWPQAPAVVRAAPNFQAPSASHCARPIQTREVPGWPQGQAGVELRGRTAKSASAEAAAGSLAAPAPAARAESGATADAARKPASPSFAPPQPQRQQQPPQQIVTAGMVDDNADFTSYLAFRDRTRVEHRARDIRERYLLEVKDARGRGISDAEVAVQAPSGHAMWARTDTAGRVWLHPNAFDPSRSPWYDVAVRKDGRQSSGRLQRGQKSAVEVVLEARPAEARARLDLVFLVDATGSMADEIDKLKATLRTIAADVARLPSQPDLCFGLVAYRDKGDAFLLRSHDFTNDLGAFQGVLNALHAAGGGDYPEAMNEALHETVHNLSWRGDGATRMVVLLADAPPHLDYGGPYYDDDMLAALGKGIKVFSVGASGLDKQGEYIQRQIAQYTGGRFVFLTYAQAHHPGSGPGRETVHDVNNYSVDTLDRLVVRLVSEELGKLARGS